MSRKLIPVTLSLLALADQNNLRSFPKGMVCVYEQGFAVPGRFFLTA